MPAADPLADLALRERQLEAHLLRSHEYQGKAARRTALLALILAATIFLTLGEAIIYSREPRPKSEVVLGSIDLTGLVAVIAVYLLFRTRGCLRRLNERWITPEAKKALKSLRQERLQLLAQCRS
jgi:hypothetical protein